MALGIGGAIAALESAAFVPVVRAGTAQAAYMAARALAEGGCEILEIALTVPEAIDVLARLKADGHMVGAGTVLTADQAASAIAAGADFLVAPSLNTEVVAFCQARDRLMIPGALTPTEVIAALAAGAPIVKIFPVDAVGGPRYLKLLRDPLPGLRTFPTGGITLDNAADYLARGAVAVGVGSALVDQAAIAAGDFEALTRRAGLWKRRLSPKSQVPGPKST